MSEPSKVSFRWSKTVAGMVILFGFALFFFAQYERLRPLRFQGSTIWERYKLPFGWPMECGTRKQPIVYGNPPPQPEVEYDWNIVGLGINILFFAAITASAVVVARNVCDRKSRQQFSLLTLICFAFAICATLATVRQEYPPTIVKLMNYAHVVPVAVDVRPRYLRLPIYVGIACLAYVSALVGTRLAMAVTKLAKHGGTHDVPS